MFLGLPITPRLAQALDQSPDWPHSIYFRRRDPQRLRIVDDGTTRYLGRALPTSVTLPAIEDARKEIQLALLRLLGYRATAATFRILAIEPTDDARAAPSPPPPPATVTADLPPNIDWMLLALRDALHEPEDSGWLQWAFKRLAREMERVGPFLMQKYCSQFGMTAMVSPDRLYAEFLSGRLLAVARDVVPGAPGWGWTHVFGAMMGFAREYRATKKIPPAEPPEAS